MSHLAAEDRELLVSAAVLHDIGYAPSLARCGFHPLDGARALVGLGAPRRVAALVAHHSCAIVEARLRGLDEDLGVFHDEGGAVRDALWYCDLTTNPVGERVAAADRLAEIVMRYGEGHVVTRFVELARPELLGAVERTERRLGATS